MISWRSRSPDRRNEKCALLTGDQRLRQVGQAEGVDVHGTLWLIEQMLQTRTIHYRHAETGYVKMRAIGRRLPWEDVETQLRQFKK